MPPPGGTRTAFPQYQVTYAGGKSSFGTDFFGPGNPVPPTNGQQDTRFFDFAVGQNQLYTPRSYEAFGFAQLRSFANIEMVRLAIETRKDQVGRMKWSIKKVDQRMGDENDPRAEAVQKLFRKPNGRDRFHVWMRKLLEDLFVLDAPVLERMRTFGGQVTGWEIVPGDTINILVDQQGRRPRAPEPAFEQVIKGRIWAWLTEDDIVYSPRNVRSNHIYGFGPVEQIIVTAMTAMRRQSKQLSYFTEGNIPAGILNAPEGWTPDQIKTFQQWFDGRLTGNDAERAKLLWVPAGTEYKEFVAAPIKDEFDEWLARIVAFAFSLPPTPFIKMMNRATAEESGDRALEEGLEPVLVWVKEVLDSLIHDDLGLEDLEFTWDVARNIDPLKEAQAEDIRVKNGVLSIDEVRDRLGRGGIPGGEVHRVYGGAPVPLDAYEREEVRKDQAAETAKIAAKNPAPVVGAPGKPKPKPVKGAPAVKKIDDLFDAALEKSGVSHSPLPFSTAANAKAVAGIRKALNTGYKAVLKQLRADLAEAQKVAKASDDDDGYLNGAISLMATAIDVIADFLAGVADTTIEAAIAQIGVSVPDDLFNQVNARAVDEARRRAAELVGMVKAEGGFIPSANAKMAITDTMRLEIRAIIEKGLAENIGLKGIVANLKAAGSFSDERALLIATTEVARANSMAALEGYKAAREAGVNVRKAWILGPKPCKICVGNNEQGAIDLDDKFQSGDDAPPQHPNCECAVSPVVID